MDPEPKAGGRGPRATPASAVRAAAFAALLTMWCALCCDCAAAPTFSPAELARILRLSPTPPSPIDETNRVADDERAARLGQRLFFDARLSPDARFSCATCHDPAKAFTDGLPVAAGRTPRERSAPTLLNVAQQRWLNWDGSADTLWAQALRPIEHPQEMGGDRVSVARLVRDDATLRGAYEAIFGALPALKWDGLPQRARPWSAHAGARPADDAMDAAWNAIAPRDQDAIDAMFANVGKAIAAYERRLTTGPAPLDTFVEGLRAGEADVRRAAISPSAQRGLKLFIGEANCRTCHTGPNFSDGEFHSVGAPVGAIVDGAPPAPTDSGRFGGANLVVGDTFNAAGPHSDGRDGPRAMRIASLARSPETWGQVRTPSLRNVAMTAPYMHRGQLATLPDVVRFYSTLDGQVVAGHHRETILAPLRLDDGQVDDLVAFLGSLTGAPPAREWTQPP